MFVEITDALAAMIISHQSGFNMLDHWTVRMCAAGWLADRLER